mmetsp:Transcript_39430/g.100756  ORF Transcript_39430/g.100756 Transcript_39430/m.100756 type:complete len:250 (+) Transcript_39430:323-1072(+)
MARSRCTTSCSARAQARRRWSTRTSRSRMCPSAPPSRWPRRPSGSRAPAAPPLALVASWCRLPTRSARTPPPAPPFPAAPSPLRRLCPTRTSSRARRPSRPPSRAARRAPCASSAPPRRALPRAPTTPRRGPSCAFCSRRTRAASCSPTLASRPRLRWPRRRRRARRQRRAPLCPQRQLWRPPPLPRPPWTTPTFSRSFPSKRCRPAATATSSTACPHQKRATCRPPCRPARGSRRCPRGRWSQAKGAC